MILKTYRGRQFDHTHENKAFNYLYDALSEHCMSTGQEWHLLANFFVGSRELDALLIKPNALIIIDFKDFSGTLRFSEGGPWMMEVESGNHVQVKGGASINPLRQLKINKHALIDFLDRSLPDLNATCNWRHTAALVAFQGTVEFDSQQLPGGIKPWFYITDSRKVIRDLDAIVSKQISLAPKDIERIVSQLGIDPYVPAGGPEVRPLEDRSGETPQAVTLTSQQNALLQELRQWLQGGSGVFRVSGMASTGKRFLFPLLVDEIKATGCDILLLTPSARLSATYYHPLTEPTSIYTWLYNREPDRFESINDRKIGIHEIRKDLLVSGVIPVLVDAHLLSDEEFEVGERRYGSGRLIQDFLSVIEEANAPFVVIGDPYQTPHGSLQRSLMTNSSLEQRQLSVRSCPLTEQIVSDQEDGLSQFQAHLVSRLISTRFNRLPRATGKRVQILDSDSKTNWEPDIGNVRAESVLICATHEQNNKINAAVKDRILKHPNPVRLAVGDRIDFYNRTPILPDDSDTSFDLRWISAGEVALVDYVDETIESHLVELRGRSEPVHLHFQLARCRLPGLGEVRFRYLVEYLEAERPELSIDQTLAIQVLARKVAKPILTKHREKLPDKKDPAYKDARDNFDRIEYQILQAQGYASAAQIRLAHAMTLHRAQGRRWPKVWVNASRSASSEKPNNSEYFRWLYTASTIADELLIVRQMPALSPLHSARINRAHDLKVGPFSVRTGLYYDTGRQPTEQEAVLVPPAGFNDLALLPLLLTLRERIAQTAWRIDEWREYRLQVVIKLVDSMKQAEAVVRLNYNNKLVITNMVFISGDSDDQATIKELFRQPFAAQSEALQDAFSAITERAAAHGFGLAEASETDYRLQLVFEGSDDAVDVQVNADKQGMVSSVRIGRATSETIIARFISAMEAVS